ncbi:MULTISPECIES: WD40/YVTN/BNR-like repeat-containing protein [Bacillus amyloliquefaciens group]|uniref:WD40/YVTN/BNR-like repeat-containing protein n=1 Tax=Bacillus amyloliquefaciens group TaxID=1938374 RepID=UPI0013635AFF|nr:MULTISPECIES: hypothetical protein [Bacillus amyloliquefaciens group]MBO3650459.1 hypothetical protein [Bacillus amyloliquefaciens]MCJ2174218.1 hypothetical protein [Bacillus amyloliquefaciens]MCR4349123.1 hypothetical protein [Bacillus amyloliquefaciens]MCR4357394.1 hypothetical protein [Bacillus amyloliquefaciens]MDX7982687.1 hypothetical protein [Bacillus velezensis]
MNRKSSMLMKIVSSVSILGCVGFVTESGSQTSFMNNVASAAEAGILPSENASLLSESGDISHYHFVNSSSVFNYADNKWVYKSSTTPIKDVKSFDGKNLYATADDGYYAKILKWNNSLKVWDQLASFRGGPIFDLIKTSDNKFAAGGGESRRYGISSTIFTSIGGDANWSQKVSGYKSKESSYTTGGYLGVVYTGVAIDDKILMFGNSYATNYISESSDGIKFTRKGSFDGEYFDAIYNGDKVVAVGQQAGGTFSDYGLVAVSFDKGESFQTTVLGYNAPLNSVTYKDGVYITVGDLGSIYYSEDAHNWTKASSPTANKLNDVEWDYVNKRYVAVGDSGTVLFSLDGKRWISVNSGIKNNITNVVMMENS